MRPGLPSCLVLATGNPGKLREMREILAPWRVTVRSLGEFAASGAEETGETFVQNAVLKARQAAAVAAMPAIADDSGLEVDALHGAPGVRSARYAGDHATDDQNNAKLLRELEAVPVAGRTARYRCAIVFVRDANDRTPTVAEAAWEGRIARSPRGSGGFGYDPLFVVGDGTLTAAELDPAAKNARSHRGQALQRLVALLAAATP